MIPLPQDASGRQVAVKELLFSRVPGAKELDDFEREARILTSLDHPRIPKVLGHFSAGRGVHTRLCLVQEFVEGESLQKRLDGKHRFSEAEAREIARQLLPVLDYLHTRVPPIVHRDLKPANVMARPNGDYVLVDFGAARDLKRGETHGATLAGTFGYMPLEQMGGTVNPTSDLYALGMTLVHLLSGREPADLLGPEMKFDARTALSCSPELREWLAKLTAGRREDRFESAPEALAALGSAAPVTAVTAVTDPAIAAGVLAMATGRRQVAPSFSRGLWGLGFTGLLVASLGGWLVAAPWHSVPLDIVLLATAAISLYAIVRLLDPRKR